jgi:beta-galactosidase GanA
LGAAYYPEDWPLELIDEDIELMKRARCNVMRIGEFAWSRMEPQEGQYDFDWLRLVVDKLGAAGIATVMGTPTCTPPAWLSERYPEILSVAENGRPITHGGRRHACPNSPVYRDHSARIVTRLAEEFGRDERVIGWQIDNELYYNAPFGCCCPVCLRKFQDRLREQFGTVEALNAAWDLDLWSQTYQAFGQAPHPTSNVWHHPSLKLAWMLFQSDSYVEFCEHQVDTLRPLTAQPIGTDMMPFAGLSYYKMHRKLDLVQYNHYDSKESLWRQVFWMDYVRPIKDAPFWNTETQTTWGGGLTATGYKEPGFCRVNSWLPLAMGGEANLYWLWRVHWAGQELMHGSVVDSFGRPTYAFGEVQELGAGFETCRDFITGTRPVKPKLAVHFSTWAWHFFEHQPLTGGFKYLEALLAGLYRGLFERNWRADVVDPAADLADYSVVISPFLPALDEEGLRGRLAEWIKAGGAWIATPFTDIRDLEGAKLKSGPYGSLEEWGQVFRAHECPIEPKPLPIRWADGTEGEGSLWQDALEPRGAEVLATYTAWPNEGKAAITRARMGKGQVIVMATLPRPEQLLPFLEGLFAEAGIKREWQASESVLAVPRAGEAGAGAVVLELEGKSGTVTLPRPATDLLSGERYEGEVALAPYATLVLKY